jgi:signal transduction histidine kinase/CheY-like chemotaxis protein
VGADSEHETPFKRRGSLGTTTLQSSSSWGPPRLADPPQVAPMSTRLGDILASKLTPVVTESSRNLDEDFYPLAHDDLAKLIRRNPRGKFYNLDPDSDFGGSSSSDDAIYDIPRPRATPSKSEAQLLNKHFPRARHVIFLPLWDSTASRFSALFAYTTSDFRSLSNNPDFLYCIAFSNCVMTEITRIATLAADQQKSDFIGSVSHELRSPLHGILASCEFLTDTDTSTFQQSLIDTADSCARTLLDTINMVLDYSKINAFERNARNVRKKSGDMDTSLVTTGQQQLNIFGNVDLATITEEVVEGVATGQVFKDSLTGHDAVDLGDPSRQTINGRKDIEIILDISPRANLKDWIFVTQPGAFRRIIMNIFGNALKYTRAGYIRVRLEAQTLRRPHLDSSSDEAQATLVKLTITDTGQGMSPQFMRTKLYTPFAQENSIAPGTGLGLSLVKSMVTMLNGEINIESAVGVGTEVTVTFPMTLSTPTNSSDSNSGSTPSSAGSIERVKDDSLLVVQKKARGRKALLFPDASTGTITDATRMIRHAINRYLTGWFGFEVITPFSPNNLPDIIITDESDLPQLLKLLPSEKRKSDRPMIIVLSTAASRKADKSNLAHASHIEAVSHPFGPFKLARSIKWCLEKLQKSMVEENEAAETQAITAVEKGRQPAADDLIASIDHMTLRSTDPDQPDVHIVRAGSMAANEDSVHAQLVIDSSTDSSSSGGLVPERQEYPFPHGQGNDGTVSPSNLEALEKERPILSSRKTISPTRPEISSQHAEAATTMSSKGAMAAALLATRPPSAKPPRLLLVDDNKVNLRLLQMFMKKRKYMDVYSAEDGSQAVSVYRDLITQQQPHPPDIIFMDISMPVMNGFQATREIRQIEQEFREQFPSPMQTPPSSLIIALTGLASGRDQSEALTSG